MSGEIYGPTVGRIVLYLGTLVERYPAIVIKVHEDGLTVDLVVFGSLAFGIDHRFRVPIAPTPDGQPCWSWPVRQ